MKFDWKDIKAHLILWPIVIIVFGVSYLPFASLLINGDTSWSDYFWSGFADTVDIIREYNFLVLIIVAPITFIGWLLEKFFGNNVFSKSISILIFPVFAISFLVFIFTGNQDPATYNLRP